MRKNTWPMGPWGARLVALLLSLLGLLPVLRRARQFGFGSHQAEGRRGRGEGGHSGCRSYGSGTVHPVVSGAL